MVKSNNSGNDYLQNLYHDLTESISWSLNLGSQVSNYLNLGS